MKDFIKIPKKTINFVFIITALLSCGACQGTYSMYSRLFTKRRTAKRKRSKKTIMKRVKKEIKRKHKKTSRSTDSFKEQNWRFYEKRTDNIFEKTNNLKKELEKIETQWEAFKQVFLINPFRAVKKLKKQAEQDEKLRKDTT